MWRGAPRNCASVLESAPARRPTHRTTCGRIPISSSGPPGSDPGPAARDLFEAALSEAARSWGSFALALPRFAGRATSLVAGRLERSGVAPTADAVLRQLARTPLADLAIAIACADRAPGAWETLVARLTPRLVGLARRRGASDADARTLAADVLSETCLPAGGRTPIETYAGAGTLFGWAAVILVRRLHRTRAHAGRREAAEPAEAERAERPGAGEPIERLADDESVRRFDRALAAAWVGLSGRERLALACRYADGMPQTRIATLLRVSEPHTSRILAAAVERLGGALRAALGPDALERAGPALAEALRRRLVSASPPPPHPVEEPPRPRGPR